MQLPFVLLAAIATAAPAAVAQDRPVVLATTPPHLAPATAAGKTQITVRFDQDMNSTLYSVCGGGPSFPKVHGVSWRDARTFAIDVELEEDRVYALDLSCATVKGFWSAAGQRLAPTPWRFATVGPAIPSELREEIAAKLCLLLRERYSYRDRLGIDWDDFELRAHDRLVECPSMAAIALVSADLLAVPQDPHISVRWLDASLATFEREARPDFDVQGVRASLPGLERVGRIGLAARTDDGIGYLFVGSFSRDSRSQFELCLDALHRMLDCKGIVIDVRQNGGGDEDLARRLAAFFVDGEVAYAAHRYRDATAEDGFGPKQVRTLRGNVAPNAYRGSVAVLMGQQNMSSCEAFLLMMKQCPRATLVGSASQGSSGNPKPHALAPGLTVLLPSWQALRPDGTCFEGEGIQPTVPIEMPIAALGNADPVLREALAILRGPR